MNVFTERLRLAADAIETHGWTQGTERDTHGAMCITGAIRYCAPQTGDEYLVREVLRHRRIAETWNDDKARTKEQVLDGLRAWEILDENLADTLGPNWRRIVALVRQAATLTLEQVERLDAIEDAWRAAWDGAAWDAAWRAARGAARRAAWDAAGDAAGDAARRAARGAAYALVVIDLVGQYGLEQHHIDALLGPWVSVMGMPEECAL